MKLIELQGAASSNKGAQLMTLACVARFEGGSGGRVRCCYYPRDVAPQHAPNELPILQVLPEPTRGVKRPRDVLQLLKAEALGVLLRPIDRRRYGLVQRSEIDGLVDISGYAYGDAWKSSGDRVLVAERYRQRGKPVVLLPQMLGPFERTDSRSAFRRLAAAADLVYARDPVSLEYALDASDGGARIELAPDITIGFECPVPPLGWHERQAVYVIPNEKVLQKAGSEWGASYVEHMGRLVRVLHEQKASVELLLHESRGGDRDVAQEIVKSSGVGELPVREERDPIRLKRRLARARLVIGSRYHGLVSALSSGTPAIALGWAHKYRTLQNDFGVPELQHGGQDSVDALLDLATGVLDETTWNSKHAVIVARGAELKRRLEQVWRDVGAGLRLPE